MTYEIDPDLEMKSDDLSPREAREARLHAKQLAEVELTNARTAMVKLRAERDALVLAKSRGDLIDRRKASLELGFLITTAREAVRAWHVRLPRELFGKDIHQIGQILREAEVELLNTLAELPEKLNNLSPDWQDRIDEDLRQEGEGNGNKAKERAKTQREEFNERRRARRAAAKEP